MSLLTNVEAELGCDNLWMHKSMFDRLGKEEGMINHLVIDEWVIKEEEPVGMEEKSKRGDIVKSDNEEKEMASLDIK